MGSDEILKKIKSGATGLMITGLCMTVIPLVVIFCALSVGMENSTVLCIIMAVIILAGIPITVYNVRVLLDPSISFFLKRNPEILSQADELLSQQVYHDKFIIMSPRIIASAIDLRQISYTDEVFVIYIYVHKTNGVMDQKQLKLETARRTIHLSIMFKKDDEIDELINTILSNCRYARFGYNEDSMNYLKQMRALWKKDQEQKKNS